jgi:hypothetical protein
VTIDPRSEAQRLLEEIPAEYWLELAEDPAEWVPALFDGLSVGARSASPGGGRCAVDGTYDPGPPPRIHYADDVTLARQRFTVLHELGHHLIEYDDRLNDLDIPDVQRRDEEICNEVAASVLLPDDLVEAVIPLDFAAEEVARLHARAGHASRAACCVAAVRRLHHHGCVILGDPDGTANFVAHHPATPWRIARGTYQGDESLLLRAGRMGHVRDITQVRFANGNTSSNVHGDAYSAPDGWVFMVAVADTHSPWVKTLNFGTPAREDREVVECGRCDHAFTPWWAPCRRCGDYECPRCHHCSCGRAAVSTKRCRSCTQLKAVHLFPGGGDLCTDCQ